MMYFYSSGTNLALNGSMHINDEGQMQTEIKEFEFSSLLLQIQFTGSYVSQLFGGILTYFFNLLL